MQLQIFSDYPWWFWFLCVLGGALYAAALYWRERRIAEVLPKQWWIPAALRFIGATILLMLLLNPYMRSSTNETEKPIVVLLQDNSSSIAKGIGDTTAFLDAWESMATELSKDFDVRKYVFGETMEEDGENHFDQASTNISQSLLSLNNLYEQQHVAGVILASDGIYNSGSNPVFIKNELNAPIYTVALGDTTRKKDVRILRTLHNNLVYLDDRFTVQADIEGIFCNGINISASISEINKNGNRNLGEQSVNAVGDQFNGSVKWEIAAQEPGIRHYRINVRKVEGEFTTENNVQDIYIEVLDARQKILLLANAPHPDLQALRLSITQNKNYDVDVQLAGEWKGNIADYDLVILHQLPSSTNTIPQVINEVQAKRIPTWFITGSQTSVVAFNKAQSLLNINSNGQSANEVTALMDLQFNLFTIDDKTLGILPRLPALSAPYGQYTASKASQVVAYQKIGSVATKTPLLLFSIPGGEKTAVLCGENIWKWRLYDYVLNNTQEASDEIIGKTVQYLAAKNDKKQFRVSQARAVYTEQENIILDAELYNDTYELINTPDATITITDESGKDFDFQFSKTGNSYTLSAGYFSPGNYSYKASTTFNGKTYTDAGAFSVSPVRLETINITADHRLMNQLAVQTGGSMAYPENMASLVDAIKNSAQAKPVMREITRTQSIIHLKWIFAVILLLLSVEWFIRKYSGGY